MLETLKRKLTTITLASIVVFGCASIVIVVALANETTNVPIAYANDCFYSGDWHGEWKYGSKGWWHRLNEPQFAIYEWNTDGKTYYHKSSGAMVTDWQFINNAWYYFDKSGAMNANRWVSNYYLRSDGSMATNQWIGKYHVNAAGLWDKTDDKYSSEGSNDNPYDANGKLKTFKGIHTRTFLSTDNLCNCNNSHDKILTMDFKSDDSNTNTYIVDVTCLTYFYNLLPENDEYRYFSDDMTTVRNLEINQWTLLNGSFLGYEQAYVRGNDPSSSNRRIDIYSNGLNLSTGQSI